LIPPLSLAAFNYKSPIKIYFRLFVSPKQYVREYKTPEITLLLIHYVCGSAFVENWCNMRDTDAIANASTLILGYKANLGQRCFAGSL